MTFKKLTLSDLPLITQYLTLYPDIVCDKTVGGIFMWRDVYDYRYSICNNSLLFCATDKNGRISFSYPIGNCVEDALLALEEYCKQTDIPLCFSIITEPQIALLSQRYHQLSYTELRDSFDYYYAADEILDLKGKKYAAKRNHINQFLSLYDNYSFDTIHASDIPELCAFLKNYHFHAAKQGHAAEQELEMNLQFLREYHFYNMLGGWLRVNDQVVGLSVGEVLNDTLFIHIEKADVNYMGSYSMLTNCFLHFFLPSHVLYVNREDDAGDDGLRKSKLSYHPLCLLKKYYVEVTFS